MFDVCCDTTDMRTHRHCDDAVETAPSGEPYDWASPSSSHETSPLLDIDRQRRRASLAIVLLLAAALLPASATAAKVGCPGCGTALASRPIVATAASGYLRLRRTHYEDTDLGDWVERIAALRLERAYVYFMHEDDALGTVFARKLMELWKQRNPT